jgi:hypothetical protein
MEALRRALESVDHRSQILIPLMSRIRIRIQVKSWFRIRVPDPDPALTWCESATADFISIVTCPWRSSWLCRTSWAWRAARRSPASWPPAGPRESASSSTSRVFKNPLSIFSTGTRSNRRSCWYQCFGSVTFRYVQIRILGSVLRITDPQLIEGSGSRYGSVQIITEPDPIG